MNILHIIEDKKFIKSCEVTFNSSNLNNLYLSKGEVTDDFILENKIHSVFFHFLDVKDINYILTCKVKVKFVWFFWGGDGFMLDKYYNRFLLKKTILLRLKCEFKKSYSAGIKCFVKSLIPSIMKRSTFNKKMLESIKYIDWIIPVIPGDIELLKNDYNLINKTFHFNYVTPYFFNNAFTETPSFESGKNILLGNSSSYTNNHLEAIDLLNRNIGERKVIIPLNYGDSTYANEISKIAKNKLGSSVLILREFLDYKEYNMIYTDCGIVILNHCRQQAVGNVVLGLVLGKTLYLREISTVYKFLKANNFIVRNVEDIRMFGIEEISEEEKRINYNLCFEVFGLEAIKLKVNNFFKNHI